MLAKINSVHGAIFVLALALLLSGCTPAGPRALLNGKNDLDQGNIADAVTQLQRAATLLQTNANAWNYLGVALQRAGKLDAAGRAYQNALDLNRNLLEVHYNLGMLALDQNQPAAAKTEFTAYVLRRPNDAAGWLQLGFAQLRAGDSQPAERSFSTVLALKTSEAEAYNGLGMARLQEGKSRDAVQFFAAAIRLRPDFGPAILNLATVDLQYFHDPKAALANYQAYLALKPTPANYQAVEALAASLTQSEAPSTAVPPPVVRTSTLPPESKPRETTTTPRAPQENRSEQNEARNERSPRNERNSQRQPAPATERPQVSSVPTETVRVPPEQQIVTTPTPGRPYQNTATTQPAPATNTVAEQAQQPLEVPMPEEPPKQGFWHRLFGSNRSAKSNAGSEGVTPLPAQGEETIVATPEPKPAKPKPRPIASIPRYRFTSPPKPAAGDRRAAEEPFTKARLAEQDEDWLDAEQSYQTAANADPSWFEAQYNTGVIAHRLHDYSVALPRYELALAIRPDSVDARYNFALALQAAGYFIDAANELKHILASHPNEVRAHLALANIDARALHDVSDARIHYQKVLALQPDIPQASDIIYWLSANPE